jgi:hypothetical protein
LKLLLPKPQKLAGTHGYSARPAMHLLTRFHSSPIDALRNAPQPGANGGSISVDNTAAVVVSGCTFNGGSAGTGGAIFATSTPLATGPTLLEVTGSTFAGCTATSGGMALHVNGNNAAAVRATVTGSVFQGNSGSLASAVVTGANATLAAAGVLFDANTGKPMLSGSAGALVVSNGAQADIADATFKSNSGHGAKAITMVDAAGLSISRSQFLGAKQAQATLDATVNQNGPGQEHARLTVDRCTFDAAPLAGVSGDIDAGTNHIATYGFIDAVISRSKFVNSGAAGGGGSSFSLIYAVRRQGARLPQPRQLFPMGFAPTQHQLLAAA